MILKEIKIGVHLLILLNLKLLSQHSLENLVGLYCIVPRDFYGEVYDALLDSGAPGVSTNFGVMIDLMYLTLNRSRTRNGLSFIHPWAK